MFFYRGVVRIRTPRAPTCPLKLKRKGMKHSFKKKKEKCRFRKIDNGGHFETLPKAALMNNTTQGWCRASETLTLINPSVNAKVFGDVDERP